MLHNWKHIRRKILLQHSFIVHKSGLLPLLAFGNDGFSVSACDDGLDVYPPSMECSRHASCVCRRSTELPDLRLKLRRKLGTLLRVLIEKPLQLRILRMSGGGLKPLFPVAAGFDQIIQTLDEFFPIYSHVFPPRVFFAIALPVEACFPYMLNALRLKGKSGGCGQPEKGTFSLGRRFAR